MFEWRENDRPFNFLLFLVPAYFIFPHLIEYRGSNLIYQPEQLGTIKKNENKKKIKDEYYDGCGCSLLRPNLISDYVDYRKYTGELERCASAWISL